MADYAIPPLGTPASAFQVAVPIVDPSRPPALLCDWIDPQTGDLASMFTAPHPVDAAIQLAFSVEADSGAATNDAGHRFRQIRKNTVSAQIDLKHEAERIMKPFGDRGDADVDSIETLTDGDIGSVTVNYVNLQTRELGQVTG